MKGIKLLVSIVPRGKGEEISRICRENGLTFSMISPAYGAAGTHFMDYLGLTNPEKDCVFSVVRAEFAHEILSIIHDQFHMAEPNTGIIMTVPITGVSGPRALRYISGNYPPSGKEGRPQKTGPVSHGSAGSAAEGAAGSAATGAAKGPATDETAEGAAETESTAESTATEETVEGTATEDPAEGAVEGAVEGAAKGAAEKETI